MKTRAVILALSALAAAALVFWTTLPQPPTPAPQPKPVATAPAPTFVGRSACAECHPSQTAAWQGSHHDLAMQEATPANVLGNFDNASFTYHDITSTFTRKGDDFFVTTDGPDGKLHEYKIAYTFGVYPLQQYLIQFPGGRYQALNICWDTRPADPDGGGGQRWFHLYPNQNITSSDILHWTGPYQNWNYMCAECHSTALQKNYMPATDSYSTTWSEIDVSCEACHGPASEHVAWAHRAKSSSNKSDRAGAALGLVARLREEEPGMWSPDPTTGIAKRDHPRTSYTEMETCARCHSRRATIDAQAHPGRPLADTHRLALLEPALYHADGQILDEVYEYGSFIQSRMHAAGVTCSDCHDPHTLKTAPGNFACARCHSPEKFDTPAHHFHTPGRKGSACVECHMPTTTYMVVHARHDHSLRIPRPDLTASIGTPNACNGCHADRSPQWAAAAISAHTNNKPLRPHFAEALSAARRGDPSADTLLAALLADHAQPAIARATAAQMLAGSPNPAPLVGALTDTDATIRAAAAAAISTSDPAQLAAWLAPLLTDPARLVRMNAARQFVSFPDSFFTPAQSAARARAAGEFVAAMQLDADRAEARMTLGAYFAEQNNINAAEAEYLAALRLNPKFPLTYVNLADLYRQAGREADTQRVLRDGLAKAERNADIPHALGLALVRAKQLADAIPFFEQATTIAPQSARYAYVLGVALETAGPPGRGIETLKRAHQLNPGDQDTLAALVTYCTKAGRPEEAATYRALLTTPR